MVTRTGKRPARWAPSLLALVASTFALSCTRTETPTPTRVLDRPSDLALFCVDFQLDGCPRSEAYRDNTGRTDNARFLADYCGFTAPVETTAPPRPTLLRIDECGSSPRQKQSDAQLAEANAAAFALVSAGGGDTTLIDPYNPCGVLGAAATPVCTRRKLEALVTNTDRGEIAVVDTQAQATGLTTVGSIQNLHSGQPGFGFLPVGRLPQHVRTGGLVSGDETGATEWAVTTNSGTCDLSVLDLKAVAGLIAEPRDCDASSCPRRLTPKLADGTPLGASPGWVEVAPWRDSRMDGGRTLERPRALVVFPACALVADVDLESGTIAEAVSFESGTPRVLKGAEVVACPAECGGGSGNLMPGAPPASATTSPSSIAVDTEGRRLIIGDSRSAALTIVPYDAAKPAGARLQAPRQVPLDFSILVSADPGGQRGVDVVRVGPRTGAGKFVYAVARDGTLRVVDLDQETECETNPDPRAMQVLAQTGEARVLPDEQVEQNLRRFSCFPVKSMRRDPLALSPGIGLPGGALARDVAFVHVDVGCDPSSPLCAYNPGFVAAPPTYNWVQAGPGVWVGDFAWVLGSDGRITALQVADYCPDPGYRACFPDNAAYRRVALLQTRSVAHSEPERNGLIVPFQSPMMTPLDRLSNVRRSLASRFSESGPAPRVDTDTLGQPIFTVTSSELGALSIYEELQDGTRRLALPALAEVAYLPVDPVCDVALREPAEGVGVDGNRPDTAPEAAGGQPVYRPKTLASFPNPSAVRSETWSLAWEGALAGLSRTTGRLLSDGTLIDTGALPCARGAEPADKLWLPGCVRDDQCNGGVCVREETSGDAPGVCQDSLDAGKACQALTRNLTVDAAERVTNWLATWQRRYRVVRAEQQVPVQLPGQTMGQNAVDRLTLDELPEPEFEAEQWTCPTQQDGEACVYTDGAGVERPVQVHVPLRGTGCDSQTPCPTGSTCNYETRLCEEQHPTYCHVTGRDRAGQPVRRCVLECGERGLVSSGDPDKAPSSLKCGAGFVCAFSVHDGEENLRGAKVQPRCLRAPLLRAGVPESVGGVRRELGAAEVQRILDGCFPDAVGYQVRAGDSFLVSGVGSGAAVLERAVNGECQRPTPADKELYPIARLQQPRLRFGPRQAVPTAQNCPKQDDWIAHNLKAPASPAASCVAVLGPGLEGKSLTFPLPNGLISGTPSANDPNVIVGFDTVRASRKHAEWQAAGDAWWRMERQLFDSLPLEHENSCVLSDAAEEAADKTTLCQDVTLPPCSRRIHYENGTMNLVMRLPRRLDDRTEWVIPPEGYRISFGVVGAFQPYVIPALVSSGIQAQGLRTAVSAPDGAVFIVDEGRTGSATGLRGQLMRIVGPSLDPNFLVR